MGNAYLHLLTFFFIGHACTASDQAPGTKPVDESQLDGRRLNLISVDGSIEAPGDDWIWRTTQTGVDTVKKYFCWKQKNRKVFPIVLVKCGDLTEEKMPEFLKGVREGIEKTGATTEELLYVSSDIPIPSRSFRYGTTVTLPSGNKHGMVTYVTSFRGWVISISDLYVESGESAEFHKLVGSLRLPLPPSRPREGSALPYIVVGFAGWLLGFAVRTLVWRRDRIEYDIALAAVVGMMVTRFWSLLSSSIPQEDICYVLGYEVGAAAVPGALLICLAFLKKDKAQRSS